MKNVITPEELTDRISWSLDQKIDHALGAIESYYNHHNGKVYVAFSGGKDSTVLLWLVRKLYPEAKGCFCDTGLEFPEIRDFVFKQENIDIIKPEITFKKTIEQYGYPVVSKQQSQFINEFRNSKSEKLKNLRWNGRGEKKTYKISEKWKYLVDAPFEISEKCCDILKKDPSKKYEKRTGLHPIIGTMVAESNQRKRGYVKTGCNNYKGRSTSKPISIFTEEDIWNIIHKYNLDYSKIYDMGYARTGCMFCLYGVNYDGSPNRFQKMEKTHPKQYKYCMDKLKVRDVLNYMGVEDGRGMVEGVGLFDE